MAIATTYEPIATYTAPSAQSSYTFSSIPQTYTDLVLVFSGTSVASFADFGLQLNGDTGSNYSDTIVYGYSGSAGSGKHSNGSFFRGWYISSTQTINIINIMNYSNTTTYKTIIGRGNTIAASELDATVGLYRSTSAITSVSITPQGTNIAAGSTITLYGIAAAPAAGANKATGGTITVGSGYTYHTFTAGGTFTPTANISADVLVIAGGGGGGTYSGGGGGGGAGGVLLLSNQSLTNGTGYTVTIGSGGSANTNGGDSQFGALTAAVGGGRGGSGSVGGNGGSGGGGGDSFNGGTGTTGQGYAGGFGTGAGASPGGGGGGSLEYGQNAYGDGTPNIAGKGGSGTNFFNAWAGATSTGVSGYYAGGGGGGVYINSAFPNNGGGAGGNGGGGSGSASNKNGTTNTGSGGGGGPYTSGPIAPGNGGSGIVIVRYAN
jgi:hypothetical protein